MHHVNFVAVFIFMLIPILTETPKKASGVRPRQKDYNVAKTASLPSAGEGTCNLTLYMPLLCGIMPEGMEAKR